MARVLYIEDDKEIGNWLKDELSDRGFDVTWLISGETLELKSQPFLIVDFSDNLFLIF